MAPYEPMKHLYFLVEGSVRIYGVRRDGGIFPVSAASQLTMLGDLEFCGNGVSPFFVEARTPSACVALNLDRWKEELNRDLRFLHVLLESFMEKMRLFAVMGGGTVTVRDRILFYLQHLCPQGTILRLGKGHYQLLQKRTYVQNDVDF